jgi:alpha-L-fucosidase
VDGSLPTVASPLFTAPFPVLRGGLVRAAILAADNPDACIPGDCAVVTKRFGLAKAKWRVIETDSEETVAHDGRAVNVLDENPDTIWHSEWKQREPGHPHHLVIDLGETESLTAFSYLPRWDGLASAIVERYELFCSMDGRNWGEPVVAGRFDNILANPVEQVVPFGRPVRARYIKFVSLSTCLNQNTASAAGINVFVD